MNYYAQINEDNIVISVSNLSAKVDSQHLIPLESNDTLLLGMVYDRGTQTFIDAPEVEPQPEPIDEFQLLKQNLEELEYRTLDVELTLAEILFG